MVVKDVESEALKGVLECKKCKGIETEKIIKHLKSIKNTKEDRESPDFLFIDGDKIIGIEHFLVDTAREFDNEKVSVSRGIEENIPKYLEKYEYGKSFHKDDNNYVNAAEDVSKDCVKYFNAVNNFNMKLFIKEFNRIAYDIHDSKRAVKYRNNIKNDKKVDEKDISIYYLIEIRYRKQVWRVVDNQGKEHKQAINGIPFTYDFVKALKKLNNADYVILYFADGINPKKDRFVYVLNMKDLEKTLREDKIPIFRNFKAEFDGGRADIKVEGGNGGVNLNIITTRNR